MEDIKDIKSPEETIILIDIDNTIENLSYSWCKYLNNKYNFNVDYTTAKDYKISLLYPTLTSDEIYEPLGQEDFWKNVRPYVDAVYYVRLLNEFGYKIYLCTSSYINQLVPKYKHVIEPYFPYIYPRDIIVCNKKRMIKADYLIDDNINNLIGGEYKKILLKQPYNEDMTLDDNVYRADDWEEIYDVIVNNKI